MRELIRDPEIMSGTLVISGTRVPANLIASWIRFGETDEYILQHYPSIGEDGLEAVKDWMNEPKL